MTDAWQPRVGLSWSPGKDGKTAIRLGGGLYFARIPGLVLAGPRNTDGVIAANLYRDGTFCEFVTPGCPVFPGILDTSGFQPSFATVAVLERNFKNPRTIQLSASVEREIARNLTFAVAYNFARSYHLTRFVDRADPRLGGPFLAGAIGEVRSTESSASSLYQGINFNLNKRFSNRFQFQLNYLLSFDKSDDDNERDPFAYQYNITGGDPRRLDLEYNWSDRDQRHRFNAFATFELPHDFTISPIVQFRSAQPATDLAARTAAPNTIKRNTLRKDNEFFTFDVRVGKTFKFGETMSLEGIFEAFNIFNNTNTKSVPQSLTFNFQGTVAAGFGEPRQAQLGVRFKF
jgi:hypothetical protein